jgi:hypothetical protein
MVFSAAKHLQKNQVSRHWAFFSFSEISEFGFGLVSIFPFLPTSAIFFYFVRARGSMRDAQGISELFRQIGIREV